MNHHTLVSPHLLLFSVFAPTIVLAIPLTICIVVFSIQAVIVVCCIHLMMNLILILFYHRAFGLVSFSKNGIKNRYLELKYENIDFATLIEVDLLKFSLIPTIHVQMICLSSTKQACSFWNYSKKECICVPRTRRVLKRLKECSESRSKAICLL